MSAFYQKDLASFAGSLDQFGTLTMAADSKHSFQLFFPNDALGGEVVRQKISPSGQALRSL